MLGFHPCQGDRATTGQCTVSLTSSDALNNVMQRTQRRSVRYDSRSRGGHMKEPQIRVMLVDAHQIILSGLQRLIEDEPEMSVVATAAGVGAALHLVETAGPDVIVLEVGLVEDHGADIIPQLIGGSERRVLILSSRNRNR